MPPFTDIALFVVTAVVFFIVLSVLVLVHEFGHFIMARVAGISAVEFALGLPFTKPLWSKRLKNGLKLSFYPILFGGFVRLLGEEGDATSKEREQAMKGRDFSKASVWARIGVVVAGVVMNLLLAIILFYVFLGISSFKVTLTKLADTPFLSPTEQAVAVVSVREGAPAEQAGMRPGDIVLNADGQDFESVKQFQSYILSKAGTPVSITVQDELSGEVRTVDVTPRVNPPENEGALGLGIDEVFIFDYKTPLERLTSGVTFTVDMFVYNISVISSLFNKAVTTGETEAVTKTVGGPIFIFKIIGDILSLGGTLSLRVLINFVAILSLSLAFMNILPIPAFDGGKLFFLLIEAVTGKKLPSKYEAWINQGGMILVLLLIVLISYNDIGKILIK